MAQEHLVDLLNDFMDDMKELQKSLKSANRQIRTLRSKVKNMDADEFNETPPDVVEKFYRNYERIDNMRQGIRILLNNIRRLDDLETD